MLRWRLLLGAAAIAALAALSWLDHRAGLAGSMPGLYLLPLALIVSLAASGEMLWLLAARGLHPLPWVVYGGNLAIVAANWIPQVAGPNTVWGPFGWPSLALALGVMLAFFGEIARYRQPGGVTERLSGAMLALVYVGLLLSFVVQLRLVGGATWGVPALLSLVIVVKMGDTGAYTVGRLIGRHKLAPRLSPGKTVEGLLGGLAFACAGAWAGLRWLAPAMAATSRAAPDWGWLAFGLIVGIAGVLGDLAESLLKRDLGRKDSSAWMPGFGGVLDMLDSILLAAPAAYLFWAARLV